MDSHSISLPTSKKPLPPGTLKPSSELSSRLTVYLMATSNMSTRTTLVSTAAVFQHTRDSRAKLTRLLEHPTGSILVSPFWVIRGVGEPPHKSLLLLLVTHNGEVKPMGYTGAIEEILPQHDLSFFQLVSRRTRITWRDPQRLNKAILLGIPASEQARFWTKQ